MRRSPNNQKQYRHTFVASIHIHKLKEKNGSSRLTFGVFGLFENDEQLIVKWTQFQKVFVLLNYFDKGKANLYQSYSFFLLYIKRFNFLKLGKREEGNKTFLITKEKRTLGEV